MQGTATITGSLFVSGGFTNEANVDSSSLFIVDNLPNATYLPRIANISNGAGAGLATIFDGGSGISGSRLYINLVNKGATANPYYSGSLALILTPSNTAGDALRPMKFISAIVGTPASSSFEWHYNAPFLLGASTLKMKLDVPSGVLSNSGSIVTSGSLTIASGSANTNGDSALYFGSSGSVGSWRIAPSGSTLTIRRWNGSAYVDGITLT